VDDFSRVSLVGLKLKLRFNSKKYDSIESFKIQTVIRLKYKKNKKIKPIFEMIDKYILAFQMVLVKLGFNF
jgi:hypothetical protein